MAVLTFREENNKMVIAHNIYAMNAQRQFKINTKSKAKKVNMTVREFASKAGL